MMKDFSLSEDPNPFGGKWDWFSVEPTFACKVVLYLAPEKTDGVPCRIFVSYLSEFHSPWAQSYESPS